MDKINTFECLCCGRPVENEDEICEDCHNDFMQDYQYEEELYQKYVEQDS